MDIDNSEVQAKNPEEDPTAMEFKAISKDPLLTTEFTIVQNSVMMILRMFLVPE